MCSGWAGSEERRGEQAEKRTSLVYIEKRREGNEQMACTKNPGLPILRSNIDADADVTTMRR